MNDLFDLKGKKAIVTGGSRGLGKGMAQGLHNAGVEIVIMGTNENVMSVAKEMSTLEVPVHGIVANFNVKESIFKVFEEAMEILGDLDILVNNAGTQIRHPSVEFPLEDWETVLTINLTATFIFVQAGSRCDVRKAIWENYQYSILVEFLWGIKCTCLCSK